MHTPTPSPPDIHAHLQLVAVQLASIQENYARKSFLQRVRIRLKNEFVNKSLRQKAAFAKIVLWQLLERSRNYLSRFRVRKTPPPRRVKGQIAAICNGGMGDLIIYSAFLDRLYREFGGPVIHAVVHPLRVEEATFVFHNSPSVQLVTSQADLNHATTPYDVIIKLGDFMSYEFVRESPDSGIDPDVQQRIAAAHRQQQAYRGFIDSQPSFDGLFASYAAQSGLGRLDLLGWLAQLPFTQQHQLHLSPDSQSYAFLEKHQLHHKPYITIHNGWDKVAHRHSTTVTKAWPEQHYEAFIDAFKRQFPQVLVVQLGALTSKPISNADLCLVDGTSLHEAAWVLKNSLLHVDGDSGLVHMARALHTKSVVMFGPTNSEFFHYEANEKLVSKNCTNCWWSTQDWMRSCPRGLKEPECMTSIAPHEVLTRVARHLRGLVDWTFELAALQDSVAPQGNDPAEFADWALSQMETLRRLVDHPEGHLRRIALINPAVAQRTGHDEGKLAAMKRRDPAVEWQEYNLSFQLDGPDSGAGRDYGSLYNIPAESDAFDAVVIPDFSADVCFPEFACKELLRILKTDGVLCVAVTSKELTASQGHQTPLAECLQRFGVERTDREPPERWIVLRKCAAGAKFSSDREPIVSDDRSLAISPKSPHFCRSAASFSER